MREAVSAVAMSELLQLIWTAPSWSHSLIVPCLWIPSIIGFAFALMTGIWLARLDMGLAVKMQQAIHQLQHPSVYEQIDSIESASQLSDNRHRIISSIVFIINCCCSASTLVLTITYILVCHWGVSSGAMRQWPRSLVVTLLLSVVIAGLTGYFGSILRLTDFKPPMPKSNSTRID
jgi:uncharacterized membrane protein